MSIVAEFTVAADEFLLGELVSEFPYLTVEIERVVPSENRVMPYVWVHGGDLKPFERALADSPNVDSVTVLDEFDDGALYKISWEEAAEELISGIARLDATILEARGDDAWEFRIRFENHSGLAQFHRFCREHGITYQLDRVYSLADAPEYNRSPGLTPAQREALVMAVERGYFRVPREVTFAELATDLDISEQAVSERVRRGADAVLRTALSARGPD